MNRRGGYTLLEFVLAIAIGIMLLWALYETFSTQIALAKEGRERIDEANMLRGIASRIQGDILANLGPVNPSNNLVPASSSSTGNSPNTPSSPGTPVLFNLGVLGDQTSLVLTISKVPGELKPYIKDNPPDYNPDTTVYSDLRRVTYFLLGTGDDAALYREEIAAVTDQYAVSTLPTATSPQDYIPSIPDQDKLIIEKGVKNLTFSYFGSLDSSQDPTWQDTWNGLTLDSNPNVNPPQVLGPPAAIAVQLTLKSSKGKELVVRHVIAINAANRWVKYQAGSTSTGQ